MRVASTSVLEFARLFAGASRIRTLGPTHGGSCQKSRRDNLEAASKCSLPLALSSSESFENLVQECVHPSYRRPREVVRKQCETVRAAGIDCQLGFVTRRHPAPVHEQRVVEQGVFGPDREKRMTEVSQIGV